MTVVVALDAFKGCLTAPEACTAVADGLRAADPAVRVRAIPMADGGEGTAAVLMAARPGGVWVHREVTGPLPEQRVKAGFLWFADDRTAVVEMAAASGLPLLAEDERDPMRTTTRGTGELLAAAAAMGARHILLTIGGSATVDGGVGVATVLGWRFLDAAGRDVAADGGHLLAIATIVPPLRPLWPRITVLCDVTNPLCGPHGAAAVFAPQKGATPQQVAQLDAGLRHLAKLVAGALDRDILAVPGGGAAGGLGAGMVAFFAATLTPGVTAVIDAAGLRPALQGAAWCITGEGCFDETSLKGKVVSGVVAVAREAGVSVSVVAGEVRMAPEGWHAAGIRDVRSLRQRGMTIGESLRRAPELLYDAARLWLQQTRQLER